MYHNILCVQVLKSFCQIRVLWFASQSCCSMFVISLRKQCSWIVTSSTESMDVLAANTRVNKYVPIPIDLESHLRMNLYCQVCSGRGQTRVYGYQNYMPFIMRNNTEHLEHARKALEDGEVSFFIIVELHVYWYFFFVTDRMWSEGIFCFAYPWSLWPHQWKSSGLHALCSFGDHEEAIETVAWFSKSPLWLVSALLCFHIIPIMNWVSIVCVYRCQCCTLCTLQLK